MEYFVMQYDDRVLSPLKVNLDVKQMESMEAFVTYEHFNEYTSLVDYFHIKKLFKYCFCISDELKESLEIYADHMIAVPFFVTDIQQKNQKIYWKIEIDLQDCLEIIPNMRYDHLTIVADKIKSKYIFRVAFDKQEYIIVSLHLAEDILRKNLCGIKFIPVHLK